MRCRDVADGAESVRPGVQTDNMLKRCGMCGLSKPLEDFHRRGAIRQSVCRTCRRAYDAAYHRRTHPRRIEQKRRYHAELVEWYRRLKDAPCSDCGGRFHHAAMAWDHREPATNSSDVSSMIGRTHSRRQIVDEIAKCDLVCANCHAVRTFRRRGVAQSGRAPGLGPRGFRRFESDHPDFVTRPSLCAAVLAALAVVGHASAARSPTVTAIDGAWAARMTGPRGDPAARFPHATCGSSPRPTGASTDGCTRAGWSSTATSRRVAGRAAAALRRALPDPPDGAGRRLRRRATSARSRPTTRRRSTAATSTGRPAGRSTHTAVRSTSTRSRTPT